MTKPGVGGVGNDDAEAHRARDAALKLLKADHFGALQVSRTATAEAVKTAYIEAVKVWHPDRVSLKHEALKPLYAQVFARLELARATLSAPDRRAEYVASLSKPNAGAAADDLGAAEASVEFKKAEGLLKKNDAANADRHLQRALQLAPKNVEYRALFVWQQARPDADTATLRQLVAELGQLIERDPKVERAYMYRGQLRKRLGQADQAVRDFARAVELNPKNVDAEREVRLHRMRTKSAADTAATKSEGAVGFFRKLLKR